MTASSGGESPVSAESDQTGAFRQCAALHGLRLHCIHLPACARAGLQATIVFDCSCGVRWIMRVEGSGVVRADAEMLMRYGRPGEVRGPRGVVERPASPETDTALPTLEEVERRHIFRVLEQTGGNRSQAAKILAVDPKTLYNKMKAYLARA